MGDDKAVLRKIRSGQLHGAVLTAGGLNQVYPDIELYGLPMVFNDVDEGGPRTQPDGQRPCSPACQSKGFVGFGIAEVGLCLRHVERRASRRSRRSGRRRSGFPMAIRAPSWRSAPSTSRRSRCPLPTCSAACRPGLINTVAVPPVGAIALQWHTQLKYVFDLPLLYVYGLLAVRDRQFDRLEAGGPDRRSGSHGRGGRAKWTRRTGPITTAQWRC